MNRMFASLALAALAAFSPPVMAETVGMPYTPASSASPENVYQWTGIYLSGGVGAQIGDTDLDWDKPDCSVGACPGYRAYSGRSILDLDGSSGASLTGDVRVGFDARLGTSPFLAGVFADYSFGGLDSQASTEAYGGDYTYDSSIRKTWGVGARAGVVIVPKLLVYGGYKYQKADLDVDFGWTRHGEPSPTQQDLAQPFSRQIDGHVILAGVEAAIAKNVTLGVEYNYEMYGRESFEFGHDLNGDPEDGNDNFKHEADVSPDVHSVKARLTFRTNFGN